tara:strand:- start:91 stop:534 length:444 start_codon:yes stop_codon:yes gene_type:complete
MGQQLTITFEKETKKWCSTASWCPSSHDNDSYVSLEIEESDWDPEFEYTYTEKTVDGKVTYIAVKGDKWPIDEEEEKRKKDENVQIVMRQKRDELLKETDWMSNSDVTMNSAWKTYRQNLRDIPENSTPSIDENNNLLGVDWPEKPA